MLLVLPKPGRCFERPCAGRFDYLLGAGKIGMDEGQVPDIAGQSLFGTAREDLHVHEAELCQHLDVFPVPFAETRDLRHRQVHGIDHGEAA